MKHRAFENLVIRASAGSGKTFQLTNRYLQLIDAGVPPETILATTFTRKAAGEILDRILTRLSSAALSPSACTELSRFVRGDDSLDCRRAAELLQGLIENLPQMHVGTLDSFFAQIAGGFVLELGLPLGWKIVEPSEDTRLLNRAILLTFSNPDKNSAAELLNLLFSGESLRSLTDEVYRLVSQLMDVYRRTERGAWSKLPRLNLFSDEEKQRAIISLNAAVLPMTKGTHPKPNSHFVSARDDLIELFENENWEKFFGKKIVLEVLAGTNLYRKIPMDETLSAAIKTLIWQARAVLFQRLANRTEATCELLSRISEEYEVLKRREKAYRFEDITYRLADRILTLGDPLRFRFGSAVGHLLLDEFQDTTPIQWSVLEPFAQTAAGQSAQTAAGQSAETVAGQSAETVRPPKAVRRVFSPDEPEGVPVLAVSAREETDGAPDHSFFCVGDVKQSIYGWRGGVSEIFDEVCGRLPVCETRLDLSWRSAPTVLNTVTEVFGKISQNPTFAPTPNLLSVDSRAMKERAFLSAARRWESRFAAHQPAKRNASLSGFCSLETGPVFDTSLADVSENADDSPAGIDSPLEMNQKSLTFRYAVERIAEIHRRSPSQTVGVLVRKNETVEEIVRALAERQVEASQEGGVPLANSPAVRAILSVLTLADHPGDTLAAFHAASIPEFAPFFAGLSAPLTSSAGRTQFSRTLRDQILTDGIPNAARRLADCLAPRCDANARRMLNAFLILAISHTEKAVPRMDRFLDMVRAHKTELSSAANLRVMNFHQCKGLEFDIVVLPELDSIVSYQPPKYIVRQKSRTGPIEAVLRQVDKNERMLLPKSFQKAYEKMLAAEMEEALDILYVGMTRAIRELVMIVPPNKNGSNQPDTNMRLSNILIQALAGRSGIESVASIEGENVLYSVGDPRWYENEAKTPRAVFSGVETISFGDTTELKSVAADSDASDENPSLSDEAAPSQTNFRRQWRDEKVFLRGLALHRCFEQVRWLDRELPTRETLREVLLGILFDSKQIDQTIEEFYRLCEGPNVRRRLSRSECRKFSDRCEWSVMTEYPIWSPPKRGMSGFRRGIIDRLLLCRENDRVIAAEIIDYKTNRLTDPDALAANPSDFPDLILPYRRQLEEYRERVAAKYSLDPEKIALRLLFVTYDLVLNL